jgi:TRAP-type C4-dicarboxylate transport system permease small subunit
VALDGLLKKTPRSLASWAFVFLWLGCASIALVFLLGPLAQLRLIDNDTVDGLAMGVGLGIAPLCFIIAAALGLWQRWRIWTGADQPAIGLNLNDDPPRPRPKEL